MYFVNSKHINIQISPYVGIHLTKRTPNLHYFRQGTLKVLCKVLGPAWCPFGLLPTTSLNQQTELSRAFRKALKASRLLGILSKSDTSNNSQCLSRSSVMFNKFCLLLINCDILCSSKWIIFWARWWWANVYKDQEGDPRWFDAWVQQCQWGAAPLHSFGGSWKCQRSRRPSPTIHPVLYVSCNCPACSSLGAFQPRAGLAKRWALASAGRWACALLQRASADADTSFSFFFGSVVEYCAAQQKLRAWLWWGTK